MKETIIIEKEKVELRKPILIEGFPGLGVVGKIATDFLIRQMKAKKLAEMYSPHFPYYVLVSKKGSIRLLRTDFYYWKNETEGNDLIFLTGDTQAQTVEGQYEIADHILRFAEKKGVKLIITIGGYRREVEDKPQVVAAATDPETLSKALEVGAINSPLGNPIVGTAGLILGLAKFKKINALCLLGETLGYLPDLKAAKSVLKVLLKIVKLEVDLSELDKEIDKSEQLIARMQRIEEQRMVSAQRRREAAEGGRVTYIG